MTTFGVLPAGVRLDSWPEKAPAPPEYAPEILQLREQLRASAPDLVAQLEMTDRMRTIGHLLGAVSGPKQASLVTERI
jgi:hypothetical protein